MDEKTLLLIEDNAGDEELTLVALQKTRLPIRVVVVRDGAEALNYLLAPGAFPHRPLPAAVLLDLKLPKIDGLEVLRRLRADARTCLLPVIVLTSSRHEEDVAACMRAGANSYVHKPVEFTRFSEVVRQLAAYWLQVNEPLPRGG
jgi:two-component system response regulator